MFDLKAIDILIQCLLQRPKTLKKIYILWDFRFIYKDTDIVIIVVYSSY